MLKKFSNRIKVFFSICKKTLYQFNTLPAYEIRSVSVCEKTGQHLIEIKIIGKGQSITYLAEEIVVDNSFVTRFAPSDIRTITYLATCDRYETILREEKIKKTYEVLRSQERGGTKTVRIRHKETNEHLVVSLKAFTDQNLIDQLASHDAYYLGYLAGQEQTWRDCVRLKMISSENQDTRNE